MKKFVAYLLACMIMLSAVALSGCSSTDIEGAERSLQAYFAALKGFNIDSMEGNVVGEKEGDIGFEIKELSDDFRHSDNYKNRVKDMMKALSSTFVFTINSNEEVDKNTVKFDVTMKCADVNERDLNKYISEKVNKYIDENFEAIGKMDDYEFEEDIIVVQADAYEDFVIRQERVTKDFTITVSQVDGKWKVKTSENEDFFRYLEELFVGSDPEEEPIEEPAEGEEIPAEGEETTEE